MRHLHARDDPCGVSPFEQKSPAEPGRDRRSTIRQSLPLYGLYANFRVCCRGCPEEHWQVRCNPAEYELLAPATLKSILSILADEPGSWRLIVGGTALMVQYAAGNLAARKLVSIWGLTEQRPLDVLPDAVRIGASSTYTALRANASRQPQFSLLSTAARRVCWHVRQPLDAMAVQ